MARYTGPACRLCRRAGEKLFLKGERCHGPKCAVERRRRPPGGAMPRRRTASDWGIQLREKQKARVTFGLLERQFRNYFEAAQKNPENTGEALLRLLEQRLDNVVYRLDFAESRQQARQMVRHGHFTVDGKKVNIPSYQLKPEQVVSWKPANTDKPFVKDLVSAMPRKAVPGWLACDSKNLQGTVVRKPEIDEMEGGIETRLIVEFYSK